MKETGITRKLDSLGRLVIPKEIRKRFKMVEGDNIEMYVEGNCICIRKHDDSIANYSLIHTVCETLKKIYKSDVFMTSEFYLQEKNINLNDTFHHKCKQTHTMTRFTNQKIYNQDDSFFNGYICPIIRDGEHFGCFIVVFKDKIYEEQEMEQLKLLVHVVAQQCN